VRTLLNEAKFSDNFWREVFYTATYILNTTQIRFKHENTPYELPNTLEYLEESVTSNEMIRIWKSLTQEKIKEFFLDIHRESKTIYVITKYCRRLLKALMS
jgi:hypothetical protein